MQIPGNHNKTNAKQMTAEERGRQIVQGQRGSRKIPDSRNRPHPVTGVIIGMPGTPHAVKPNIPGNHNSELAVP